MNSEHTPYALLATSAGFFVLTLFIVGPSLFAQATPAVANTASAGHVLAPNAFAHTTLVAQGAVVYDVANNKIIYQKNADIPLPLASITKIMSSLVLKDALLNTDTISIAPQALLSDGDFGLLANETWGTDDLISFSLITSANDGFEALRETAEARTQDSIIARMNTYARDAGWQSFSFKNVTGLDVLDGYGMPVSPSAVGSAREVALFFAHALTRYPHLYEATREASRTYVSKDDVVHTAQNTNGARGNMPGLVASKTGFTDIAGGNLAIAFEPEPGRLFVVVVLGATVAERFSDVEMLVERTLVHTSFE